MKKLGVNIDHIATIRQARRVSYPNPAEAARLAEMGGADFITVHLREDRRHILDDDLPRIAAAISTHLNLEIAPTAEMTAIAKRESPKAVCLVPEKREELTTEGGLNVAENSGAIARAVAECKEGGMEVSLFVDADESQILAAAKAGADCVELHTGVFAADGDISPIASAARIAAELNLKVNAGHGLRLDNVGQVCEIGEIAELNIGHAIIARALFIGLKEAVAEMKAAMRRRQ